jgi:hypothetical protein
MTLPSGYVNKENLAKTPFLLFQAHKDDFYNYSQESVRGVFKESDLSKLFFHPKNIEIVQRQIILEVYKNTNKKYFIEPQDPISLQVIMRSALITWGQFKQDDLTGQIRKLNKIVVEQVTPNIIAEIGAYFHYLKMTFEPREIMDHPKCVSNSGTKTLPSVTDIYR